MGLMLSLPFSSDGSTGWPHLQRCGLSRSVVRRLVVVKGRSSDVGGVASWCRVSGVVVAVEGEVLKSLSCWPNGWRVGEGDCWAGVAVFSVFFDPRLLNVRSGLL